MLEHSYFIESKWRQMNSPCGGDHLQHATIFYPIMSFQNFIHHLLHLLGQHVGQESEATRINAEDRNLPIAHLRSCLQKGTITSQADGHISLHAPLFKE